MERFPTDKNNEIVFTQPRPIPDGEHKIKYNYTFNN